MDKVIFRHATQEDLPAIRRLIAAVHINPMSLDWRRFIVVNTADGFLIGCGQIKPHVDGSHELASIAVEEAFRGQGVAHGIITSLLNQENRRPIYLMCRSSLESFYKRFGFRSISVREMPPFFRRVNHLARFFTRITEMENHLLVMRLD